MSVIPIVLGITCALGGVLLLASAGPKRSRLNTRIAPLIVDVSPHARILVERERERTQSRWTIHRISSWLVEHSGVRLAAFGLLCQRAGIAGGAQTAIGEIMLLSCAGGVVGILCSAVSTAPGVLRGIFPVALAAAGGWVRVVGIRMAARKHQQRVLRELPTALEFLALCVTAGESLPDALTRLSRFEGNEFCRELREVARRTELGEPLAGALERLRVDVGLPQTDRLVDQLISTLIRGTSIAPVLTAHAQDQRVQLKHDLLELGGRKEVAMLIPLVFLILPVTVLFAVWPGLIAFSNGFTQ